MDRTVISLRDIAPADKEMIRVWRNLPEIRKYMYTDHIITCEEHDAWFERIAVDPTCRYWIIACDKEDVGVANLYAIDNRNQRCYWAFYVVSPNVRGKGVGTFAEYLVLRYVFEELNLNKVCCEVLDFNRGVVRMHKSFGFVQEGVLRKHIAKNGAMHDVVCLAMLKEEWEALKPVLADKLQGYGSES